MIKPNTSESLLSIGTFAKASRLSPKALRLYNELELLVPARVDQHTGYRYYSPDQLELAKQIALLRQLDLPLVFIRKILETPRQQQSELFSKHWAQAEQKHRQRRELAHYIFRTWQGDQYMKQYHVQVRQVAAQQIACLKKYIHVSELSQTISQSFGVLHKLLNQQQAQKINVPFVIYYGAVNNDSDGPIEVCQPYQGLLAPTSKVHLRIEPQHHEAFIPLTKAEFCFPNILSAYDALAVYAGMHGQSSALACREIYPSSWAELSDNDLAGEVAWPFCPTEEQA